MFDWLTPRDLAQVDAATEAESFAIDLSLPDGVYAYKLLIDGAYTLDPSNTRTRGQDGYRNNVLSLGGAPEPLLFAPAPPFVYADSRGGAALHAALRRGHGERLSLLWEEEGSGPERRIPLTLAAEEDEHLVFEARLPFSSRAARVRFELADGTVVGQEDEPGAAFVLGAAMSSFEREAPAWWKDAVVYTIFVDRFRPEHDGAPWGDDPGPDRFAGGHLEGVRRSLGELADLGVNTIYLTPIHVGASSHRYDMVDPLRVDPALGGEAALARLIEDARARGIRVILDLALTHAGRGFPAYEDVIENGRASRYAGWFQWSPGPAPQLVHYGSRHDAPLFDLRCPEVQELALRVASKWAEMGIGGLRLDAAAEVPMDLARAIRRRLREIRPDAVLLAEVVPMHAWRWRAEGAADATTDFGFQQVAVDFIANRSIDAALARRRLLAIDRARGAPAEASLRFLSTHDHPRFATLSGLAGDPARARLGALFLLTSPGVPAILYGEEVGLAARVPELTPENVWPDRAPMPWTKGARDEGMRALMKSLLSMRRRSPALSRGDQEILFAEGGLLVVRRAADGEVIDVAINAGSAPIELDIEDDERPAAELLASVGEATLSGEAGAGGGAIEEQTPSPAGVRVALGACSGVVLRRVRGAEGERRRRLSVLTNVRARDKDMEDGALDARSMPSRIDFSITELCNLRCRHCITLAPEKTREGTARTLSPWLLDRLRGPLEHAAYVGFVHGGEPLAAPVLFDVLAAIRTARAGAPAVVHLLTNGVLLTEKTAARILTAGVRSISVSLDGASAATNDAIREGGRFEQIVANLRAVVRLRREMGADVRIGVSFVLLRMNAGEASAMVDLCAAIGVDWLKLEEAVPATPFAARSLLRPDEAWVRELIAGACARGRDLGLLVVDHTQTHVLWRCKLGEQPDVAAHLAADEFANRSEIHSCRVPWEHACIEPNGDVRMGDFFGPVLGSLAERPLAELWNGPVARAERLRARASRLCGEGPVTCLPDAIRGRR